MMTERDEDARKIQRKTERDKEDRISLVHGAIGVAVLLAKGTERGPIVHRLVCTQHERYGSAPDRASETQASTWPITTHDIEHMHINTTTTSSMVTEFGRL